jgi:hypothetical protein
VSEHSWRLLEPWLVAQRDSTLSVTDTVGMTRYYRVAPADAGEFASRLRQLLQQYALRSEGTPQKLQLRSLWLDERKQQRLLRGPF